MTGNNEIDVEVGGSIRTSNTEETVTEWRKDSIAKEEYAFEKNSRCAIEKAVIWNVFKIVVFFLCLTFLIIQSVEFLGIYYQYPTNIVMEITVAKEFKLPAITLCFRNTISFQRFCLEEPDHCEEPSDLREFCEKHLFVCEGNTSTLKIPKQQRWIRKITQKYLVNDDYSDDERFFRRYNYSTKVRTFVDDFEMLGFSLKCYSENLHLYQSGSKLKTKKLDFDEKEGDIISWYILDQAYIKPFYPPDTPQVFVAIHSPYVPIDPSVDLQPIRPGSVYDVDVFLVCMGLCRSEFNKAKYGCFEGMTMTASKDLCQGAFKVPDFSAEQQIELLNKRDNCFQNCKQGCLKLQYNYRIKEIKRDRIPGIGESEIVFFVKNPEVTVLRHVPLYGSGEIFSHVGGLLGCWLGISVFTFTDIVEKFFLKVARLKKREKEKKEER